MGVCLFSWVVSNTSVPLPGFLAASGLRNPGFRIACTWVSLPRRSGRRAHVAGLAVATGAYAGGL